MTNTTPDPILSTLVAARALLAEGPERWTRGAWSLTASGSSTNYSDVEARRFNLLDAIFRTATSTEVAAAATQFVCRQIDASVVHFNDDPATTYEMVLDALARSIEVRRAEIGEQ